MRELSICEMGAVAGGMNGGTSGNESPAWGMFSTGVASTTAVQLSLGSLAGQIAKEIGIGIAVQGGISAISAGWTWATTPSAPPTYGNGNGATGGGYSGAGIGGNVSSGSTGSSHFG